MSQVQPDAGPCARSLEGSGQATFLLLDVCVCTSVYLGAGLGEASVAQHSHKQVWKGLYTD